MLSKRRSHLHTLPWFRMSIGNGFTAIKSKPALSGCNRDVATFQFPKPREKHLAILTRIGAEPINNGRHPDKQHDKPNRPNQQSNKNKENNNRRL